MSTILFWLAIVVIIVLLLNMIPGLDLFLKPLIKITFDVLSGFSVYAGSYVLWFAKRIWRAHRFFVTHLLYSAEALDPSYRLEQKNKDNGVA